MFGLFDCFFPQSRSGIEGLFFIKFFFGLRLLLVHINWGVVEGEGYYGGDVATFCPNQDRDAKGSFLVTVGGWQIRRERPLARTRET
jgi:hypothetical protein